MASPQGLCTTQRFDDPTDLVDQAGPSPKQGGYRLAEAWDGDGSLHPREKELAQAGSRDDPEGGAKAPDRVVEPDARLDQVCAGGDRLELLLHDTLSSKMEERPLRNIYTQKLTI